jgi:hypothetical protein
MDGTLSIAVTPEGSQSPATGRIVPESIRPFPAGTSGGGMAFRKGMKR